jgi:hypothetical protein
LVRRRISPAETQPARQTAERIKHAKLGSLPVSTIFRQASGYYVSRDDNGAYGDKNT